MRVVEKLELALEQSEAADRLRVSQYETLKQKLTLYRSEIHACEQDITHAEREAVTVIEEAQKKSAEKSELAVNLRVRMTKMRARLLETEKQLRVMDGKPAVSPASLVPNVMGLR